MKRSLIATMAALFFALGVTAMDAGTAAAETRDSTTTSVQTTTTTQTGKKATYPEAQTQVTQTRIESKGKNPAKPSETVRTSVTTTTTAPVGFIKGNDNTKIERRDLPAYTSLIVEGPFDVQVSLQHEPMIRVIADENLIPHIVTEVQGDTLKIYSHAGFETDDTLRVEVHTRSLTSIVAADQANIGVTSLNTPRLEVTASDETNINLSGQATELVANLNGHATLKASHLNTKIATVRQTGTSHAEVYARESLDLDIMDASKLFYYGNPEVVNKRVTGTARLNPNR